MLTTEEEAKTKRCQEGYAASPGASLNPSTDFVSQPFTAPSIHSLGAGAAMALTAAPATAPIYCLGSACMAWRWGKRINVYTPTGDTTFTLSQELGGYCGKAGKPVQLDMKDES